MTISIITINYNNSTGLRKTIQSVIAQTYNNIEYIVIDGGSTDDSKSIIEEYEKDIDFWVSEPDGGIYPAMNKGTSHAHGDYCIYMNSGDTFYSKDVLQKVVDSNPKEDIVCGDLCIGDNIIPNPDEVTMKVFYRSTLYHQATFIRTALIKTYPYDESMRSAADWKFLMHSLIFHNASYRHINIPIAVFEGGGLSDNSSSIGHKEVEEELQRCLPKRILEDYRDYCYGVTPFRQMVNKVEEIPPVRKIIYNTNRILLKVLNMKLHSQWIKDL